MNVCWVLYTSVKKSLNISHDISIYFSKLPRMGKKIIVRPIVQTQVNLSWKGTTTTKIQISDFLYMWRW